jgi:hypothetical protein
VSEEIMGIVDTISGPFGVIVQLLPFVENYQKKKQAETKFFSAFESEIKNYVSIYKTMIDYGDSKIIPIIESFKEEIAPHEMQALREASLPLPIMFADLMKAFISFAKACDEASSLKGFMDDLYENKRLLYDFIQTMKNIYVPNDKVHIDGRYYRFLQTYKKEIFGSWKTGDLPLKENLRVKAKKAIEYAKNRPRTNRSLQKRATRNFDVFRKQAQNISTEINTIGDINKYLPGPLSSINVIFDELLNN